MIAMAIFLAHDDILGDIDETAGQIARVSGFQGGIRTTFTSAVGVDEEFVHLHAGAVRGNNWKFDGFVLRVGD